MDPNKTSEALTQGLQFSLLHNGFQGSQEDTFTAFDLVAKGRIVEFNEFLFRLDQRFKIPAGTTELPNKLFLLKRADDEEKNLLFYAVHYNYHNLILYLLDYGIDPFHKDLLGRTVFHTIGYKGLLEACEIILNYLRYLHRMRLFKVLKAIKSSYQIKKSDIVFGEPSGPEAHLQSFQHRMQGFLQELAESYEDYCQRVYQDYFTILTMEDNFQRNPLHWAGLAKFTKCARVMKTLLDPYSLGGFPEFERLWGEVENLKLVKDPLSDPKIYQEVENDVERFLSPRVFKAINGKFEAKLAQLQKQVINKGDSRGLTPLHLASFSSQHELCQYLVNLGADKGLKDTLSKTALNYSSNSKVRKAFTNLVDAALEGDLYSFEYLLHSGCDINERKGISAIAPIHNAVIYASQKKDLGFLSIVVKCGADVNLPDINGWTSLHHACKEGMREVVDFLIKSKADLNKISATGLYPLHVAALYSSVDVIDYLYEKKVYMDVKDQDGMTPFLLAAKKNNLEALKRLLRYGAWLYAVDKFKWNAMHHACYLGHKKVVHFLACADSDEDRLRRMANSQDKTPFKLAHDEDTRSAMNSVWFAARSGKLDIVRRLHTLGDDINEPSPKDKRTPLMLACMEGHLLVAKYLLDHHADEKLVDRFDRTASYYARQKIIDPKMKREIDNPVRTLF